MTHPTQEPKKDVIPAQAGIHLDLQQLVEKHNGFPRPRE
jgi:hypothetical protein